MNKEKLELVYCPTEMQTADILTKALRVDRFEKLRKDIRIVSL